MNKLSNIKLKLETYKRTIRALRRCTKAMEKSNKFLKDCNKNNREQIIKTKEKLNNQEVLFDSAMSLLTFANTQVDILLNVLEEIKVITDDKIVVGIIKNAKERYELDKMIHNRKLFPNPEGLNED